MIRFVTDNLTYKVVALLFALVLWAFVKSTDKSTITATFPIFFQDVPEGITVVSDAEYVEVQVSGPNTILSGRLFQQSRVEAPVSIKPLGQESLLNLSAEHIKVPFGLEILAIKPNMIRYHLETVVPIHAIVVPSLMGDPAEGYEIRRVLVEPETVKLLVPEKEREAFSAIRTAPLSIHQLRETRRIHTVLTLPPSIQWEPQEMRITVEVEEKTVTRTLHDIVVVTESGEQLLMPATVSLTLEGKYHTMASLQAVTLQAVAQADSGQIHAVRGLPQGVRFIEADPQYIPLLQPPGEKSTPQG